MTIPSYPKVYNLGHIAIADLFLDPVVVEEKVDGSQFSFGVLDGVLHMRSKGAHVYDDTQGGLIGTGGSSMFQLAIDYVLSIRDELKDGFVFRCEYLAKPKHNTLVYERTPKNNLVLFDVETVADYTFASHGERDEWAYRLDIEPIPTYSISNVHSSEEIDTLLQTVSFLGGPTVEGVVFKNHSRFGRDGKFLAGKFVSEAFKEVHKKDWKVRNPNGKDVAEEIAMGLRTDARWEKAIQHLRERGELTDSPQDIGPLLKEIQMDVKAECEEAIKAALFKWAWPKIGKSTTRGFPEWYKRQLMERQFEDA